MLRLNIRPLLASTESIHVIIEHLLRKRHMQRLTSNTIRLYSSHPSSKIRIRTSLSWIEGDYHSGILCRWNHVWIYKSYDWTEGSQFQPALAGKGLPAVTRMTLAFSVWILNVIMWFAARNNEARPPDWQSINSSGENVSAATDIDSRTWSTSRAGISPDNGFWCCCSLVHL